MRAHQGQGHQLVDERLDHADRSLRHLVVEAGWQRRHLAAVRTLDETPQGLHHRRRGGVTFEGKVVAEPAALIRLIGAKAPRAVRVGLETGATSPFEGHRSLDQLRLDISITAEAGGLLAVGDDTSDFRFDALARSLKARMVNRFDRASSNAC